MKKSQQKRKLKRLLKRLLASSLLFSFAVFAVKKGVCVFDIDQTLTCKGAYAAVGACKEAGFDLAINTARNEEWAKEAITDGTLLRNGFGLEFIQKVKNQKGLNGVFQYREAFSVFKPFEQIFQSKSYGMRQIAKHYGYKTDDIESHKLVLFDDQFHNIIQMIPDDFNYYRYPYCMRDKNDLCYSEPGDSPLETPFPRNWQIYNAKWIGYMCLRWDSAQKAYEDAIEKIKQITEDG